MSDKSSAYRPSRLSPAEIEAAKNLDARFEALKASTGMTKAQFAKEFKVPGGASMISQNVSGARPISLAQARAYARGFNCSLADISQTFAGLPYGDDVAELISQLAARLAIADETTKKLVEIALTEGDEIAARQLSPSIVAMVRMVKAALAAEQGKKE